MGGYTATQYLPTHTPNDGSVSHAVHKVHEWQPIKSVTIARLPKCMEKRGSHEVKAIIRRGKARIKNNKYIYNGHMQNTISLEHQ